MPKALLVAHNNFSDQTVLFDAFYPRSALGAAAGNDESLALRAVESLPHRHDLRLPTMPLYPQRMGPASRTAVWNRLKAAYAAERDLVDDGPKWGPWRRARAAPRSATRAAARRRAVPPPTPPTRPPRGAATKARTSARPTTGDASWWLRSTCLRSTLTTGSGL